MRKRRRGKSVLHFFKVVWERLVKFGKVKKLKITVAAFEKQDFLSEQEILNWPTISSNKHNNCDYLEAINKKGRRHKRYSKARSRVG